MTTEEGVKHPIKKILTDIAESREIPIRIFTQAYFLPKDQKEQFPLLCDLSSYLAPREQGIDMTRDHLNAFECTKKGVSFAYIGRQVEKFANVTKEQCIVDYEGRRMTIFLNENGNGTIKVQDVKTIEARWKLGEDSFGSSFDKNPEGTYGFKQVLNRELPGVKGFLEAMLA